MFTFFSTTIIGSLLYYLTMNGVHLVYAFGGPPPREGDYRQLYPTVCATIKVKSATQLPFFMGLVEDLRYPKFLIPLFKSSVIKREDRMSIMFIPDAHGVISRWLDTFPPAGLYRHILLMNSSKFDDNWHENGLKFGRSNGCEYALIMDTDCLLLRDSLRQLIALAKVVVSPLLISPFGGLSNVHGLLGEEFVGRQLQELKQVYFSRGPLLIHLGHADSAHLTFDHNNVLNYQQSTGDDPIDAFAHSAFVMHIPVLFSNLHHYGYFIDSDALTTAEHQALFGTFLADWMSNAGPMPFPISSALPPWSQTPIKFGFDHIYLLNLRRRPERLRKMTEVLGLVGMEFTRFEAVDGQNLRESADLLSSQIRFLPGYLDPHHKRPMKLGEIGCFMSHLNIWQNVLEQGHQRVIVLEDDVRFTPNGTLILKGLVEDLVKTQFEWDFVYLGRKRMASASEEAFVPGHRFLSTVAYSYWTIGYALSAAGARKLVDARPLERLLALDEFLPIMYGRHPNAAWMGQFAAHRRTLRAFAAFPPVVEPERYADQPGYVSDTEASPQVVELDLDQQKNQPQIVDGEMMFGKNEL